MGNRRKLPARPGQGPRKPSPMQQKIRDIQDSLSGKYNAYVCARCDKAYLSIDIDEGTTPAFTPCFATYGCDGVAHSAGYPDGDPPASMGPAIIQWVKPRPDEFRTLSWEMQQHVRHGGLIRQPTQAAPAWVKHIA